MTENQKTIEQDYMPKNQKTIGQDLWLMVSSNGSKATSEAMIECEMNAREEVAEQWRTASKIEDALLEGSQVWVEWETKDAETLRHFKFNADYVPTGNGWARQGLNETATGKILICAWCVEADDFRNINAATIKAWGVGDCEDAGRMPY